MAVNWEDYLKEVMPDVDGCPIQVAENAIRNSAIEFAEMSRVWREKLPDITTVALQADYTPTPPTDARILAIHKIISNDRQIALWTLPEEQLDRFKTPDTPTEPQWYNAPTPDTLRIFPDPDDNNGQNYVLEVWAILEPTRTAESGPDFMFDDWLEPIAHGAKARLMAMAGRSWAVPEAVAFHAKMFKDGWVTARIRDAKGNVKSSSQVLPYGNSQFGFYRGQRI